jgi:hypothetical protein
MKNQMLVTFVAIPISVHVCPSLFYFLVILKGYSPNIKRNLNKNRTKQSILQQPTFNAALLVWITIPTCAPKNPIIIVEIGMFLLSRYKSKYFQKFLLPQCFHFCKHYCFTIGGWWLHNYDPFSVSTFVEPPFIENH